MIRRIIGATILTGFVWFTFSVKLGTKTFAEHIQAINKTREAQDLMNGMGSVVRPALDEAKERVLGEYIEAPTSVHRTRPNSSSNSKRTNQTTHARADDKKKQGSPSNQVRGKAQLKTESATCSGETGQSDRKRKKKSSSTSRDTGATSGNSRRPQASSKTGKNKTASQGVSGNSGAKTKNGTKVSTKVSKASSRSRNSSENSKRSSPSNSEAGKPEPG